MSQRMWKRIFVVLLAAGAGLGGCNEKKAKECVERCEREAEACVHRKEQGCEERGKRCGERCEKEGEFHF